MMRLSYSFADSFLLYSVSRFSGWLCEQRFIARKGSFYSFFGFGRLRFVRGLCRALRHARIFRDRFAGQQDGLISRRRPKLFALLARFSGRLGEAILRHATASATTPVAPV